MSYFTYFFFYKQDVVNELKTKAISHMKPLSSVCKMMLPISTSPHRLTSSVTERKFPQWLDLFTLFFLLNQNVCTMFLNWQIKKQIIFQFIKSTHLQYLGPPSFKSIESALTYLEINIHYSDILCPTWSRCTWSHLITTTHVSRVEIWKAVAKSLVCSTKQQELCHKH